MNRKTYWALAILGVGAVTGYTFHMLADTPASLVVTTNRSVPAVHDGGAETADTIEPLVVEGSGFGSTVAARMPTGDVLPMARVCMTTETRQPPRPDADPTNTVRMPYADETEDRLGLAVDPVLRILESTQPRLNLFDPSEESEPMGTTSEPAPTPDYHHNHCPYHGGYQYNRR